MPASAALRVAAPCPAASRSRSSRVAAPAATPLPRRNRRQQWAGAAAASDAAVGCLPRRGAALRCRAAAAEASNIIDVEGKIIDDRVPVTVITGFLGSGKTTLLNSILTSKEHGYRIAVIENEIGAIDIDSDLVSMKQNLDPSKEQILMLNNGCLCCTVRDDLVEMLNQLYDRRSEFDHVLIETTGLAQPAPIIQTFFLDPKVSDRMRLDGVVTLVDAKHVELHLDEVKAEGVVNEAVEQIAYADRVILNKTDLVGGADLDRLEGRIRSINSMAQITRAQKSNVPLDYVFGVGGFDLEKVEEEVMKAEAVLEKEKAHSHSHEHDHECGDANCKDESHNHSHESHSHSHASASSSSEADCKAADCTDPSHDHSHAHSHSHEHEHGEECKDAECTDPSHNHSHDEATAAAAGGPVKSVAQKHDDAVGSVAISIEGDMDLDKVNYWLGGLMEVKSNDLYRMKGVLAIKDFPARFVFQGVHMLFEGMPDREWKEGEKRVSKMVFIGKDLDEELIREGFQECVVKS